MSKRIVYSSDISLFDTSSVKYCQLIEKSLEKNIQKIIRVYDSIIRDIPEQVRHMKMKDFIEKYNTDVILASECIKGHKIKRMMDCSLYEIVKNVVERI